MLIRLRTIGAACSDPPEGREFSGLACWSSLPAGNSQDGRKTPGQAEFTAPGPRRWKQTRPRERAGVRQIKKWLRAIGVRSKAAAATLRFPPPRDSARRRCSALARFPSRASGGFPARFFRLVLRFPSPVAARSQTF